MYIGVDLGTSGIKLVLVTKDGEIVKTVSRSYELIIPQPNWSEQDPNVWAGEFMEAMREIVIGYESEISGISFSGQMHGLVILDKNDKVLRNAILWNDQRTVQEVEYLNKDIKLDILLNYTGNIALTGLTAPKILWLKRHEPKVFEQISKIMLPKDYLVYVLTGLFGSEVSDLSGTLFFNPKTKTYSQEMLKILGITESMLPRIYESSDVVGIIKPEIKQRFNLKNDVKVIAGAGDQAAGAVGVGVVGDGECSISLGTSGVVFVSSDKFFVDRKSYFQSYAHANGKYHIMAVMLNAAGAIKWWKNNIINANDYNSFYNQVKETKIDKDLFFLPYLTGERAPINDPYAKGVLIGFGVHHQQADINRAVVEGVTFALNESFILIKQLGINIKRVRITGGGAKSDVWAQMIADIFDVEVAKIQAEEGPALGAAILAMVGCHEYPNVKAACDKIVSIGKIFYPNKEKVLEYTKKYSDFTRIYPTVKNLFIR